MGQWRARTLLILILLLLLPTLLPSVTAEGWRADGFLGSVVSEERLAAGDELGCHGMPGLDPLADAALSASGCRAYLIKRSAASRWSEAPRSLGVATGVAASVHAELAAAGWTVHGDRTGLERGAWHEATGVPEGAADWWDLGRRGGSLEHSVGDATEVQAELEAGGLVNLYWEARVDDQNLRISSDVREVLEAADVWFTTWGEAWSTWEARRTSSAALSSVNGTIWELGVTQEAGRDPLAWAVPLTWSLTVGGADVVEVRTDTGRILPRLAVGHRHLDTGWTVEGERLLVVAPDGEDAIIRTDTPGELTIDEDQPRFAYGRPAAVTIAGHRTTDLWRWSKGFAESPLRFTWLVTPKAGGELSIWLPVAGGVIAVGSVLLMLGLVRRERRSQPLGWVDDGRPPADADE